MVVRHYIMHLCGRAISGSANGGATPTIQIVEYGLAVFVIFKNLFWVKLAMQTVLEPMRPSLSQEFVAHALLSQCIVGNYDVKHYKKCHNCNPRTYRKAKQYGVRATIEHQKRVVASMVRAFESFLFTTRCGCMPLKVNHTFYVSDNRMKCPTPERIFKKRKHVSPQNLTRKLRKKLHRHLKKKVKK